jgi:uncharacterized membrane protein required for colicin V production
VNIQEFLQSVNVADVLVLLFLFAFFILGFAQGAIRRLVGIGSIVLSFFLATQIQVPLGGFLASNWRQFPGEYGAMVGFLIVFTAAIVAFSLVIQGTYRRAELFPEHPVVEEIIGGLLGVFQAAILIVFFTIILDQFFLLKGYQTDPDELPFLRQAWTGLNGSGTGELLHSQVIPRFVSLFSLLIPNAIRAVYGLG